MNASLQKYILISTGHVRGDDVTYATINKPSTSLAVHSAESKQTSPSAQNVPSVQKVRLTFELGAYNGDNSLA